MKTVSELEKCNMAAPASTENHWRYSTVHDSLHLVEHFVTIRRMLA